MREVYMDEMFMFRLSGLSFSFLQILNYFFIVFQNLLRNT